MKSCKAKFFFIAMIIYYFDFDLLLFLVYKRYYFNILFNTRLINGFKSHKLLNPITDSP
jgi:hypothetical protein